MADKLILCNGFLTGTAISQFVGGTVILEGAASGNSSLGKFTYTYHEQLDPIHLTAVGSGQLTFANGDSVNVEGFGLGEKSGLSKDARDVASVTELLHFTGGSGRFVNAPGGFVVQRTQSIAITDYAAIIDTFGSFRVTTSPARRKARVISAVPRALPCWARETASSIRMGQ